MAVRRVNTLGAVVMAVIYWGGLLYWRSDELFGSDAAAQAEAGWLLVASVPYAFFIMWSLRFDLPEQLQEHRFLKYSKAYIWLLYVAGLLYFSLQDSENVGFLLVGIMILGAGTAASITCLIYTGEESSRLYGLKRLVDVYPSIQKPDGHVRFMSNQLCILVLGQS